MKRMKRVIKVKRVGSDNQMTNQGDNSSMATKQQAVAGTAMGQAVTTFATPILDRDGQAYTDKGQATGWWFVEWPSKISPKSLSAAIGVIEGTVRGALPVSNLVLTTRNGGYILQLQAEGLEMEINIGEEIANLLQACQNSPHGQDLWQADFTKRLQQAMASANN